MTYAAKYRPWLIGLLNERIYLSGHGFCPSLLSTAQNLKRLIDYHGYRSDAKLASFITRKQTEIKLIIPTNKAYETQVKKLNGATQEAEEYQVCNSVRQ